MSGYPLSISIPKPLSIPLRIRYTTYLTEVLPSGVHAKCKQTIQSYTNSRPWHRREIHFNQISVLQWCRLPIRIFRFLSKNVLHILIKITWHTFFFSLSHLSCPFSLSSSHYPSLSLFSHPLAVAFFRISSWFFVAGLYFYFLFHLICPPPSMFSHSVCLSLLDLRNSV